jgi:hypothetical protein
MGWIARQQLVLLVGAAPNSSGSSAYESQKDGSVLCMKLTAAAGFASL